ncbi:MAG: class I SAM-dependent methyltransferase [Proteobacteria bacterium]|nr:class I SAM-dependent methyltransferase [Pseudomonadota bacterium]
MSASTNWAYTPGQPPQPQSVPDLTGEFYTTVLRRLHTELRPSSYLEIGTQFGDSLAFVACPSIAIDPGFHMKTNVIGTKSICAFYQMQSDDYFARHDPKAVLGGPIEMAFLDGMHRCEFLLRDFINVERHAKWNSVVILHDCIPVETTIAERARGGTPVEESRKGWWLGDVWRTLLALMRRRPDLRIVVLDAPPSGLVCITNLDPDSTVLADNYADAVDEMLGWSLYEIGLSKFHAMVGLQSTANFDTNEKITRRFWL